LLELKTLETIVPRLAEFLQEHPTKIVSDLNNYMRGDYSMENLHS
jgi:hypothetical protein